MTGSGVLDGAKKVADKMAMGLINAIVGTRAANSGSVDGVVDNVPRSAKYGTCPPHLLKRTADKGAYGENVATGEEVGSANK